MAVEPVPSQKRAVAVFNPTAPEPGFLQPLLLGFGGENRSFVQTFSAPNRITGFAEVAWPDRDFVYLKDELVLTIGGEPLWGFLFPGEAPVVGLWSAFRAVMSGRIGDPNLESRPLLLFDIVDTLDLDDAKPDVFTRAFRAYAEMGVQAAARWRDRAILEPALARMLPRLNIQPHRTTVLDAPADHTLPRLRARSDNDEVVVHLEGSVGETEQSAFQREYDRLAEQFPDIFPHATRVFAGPPPRRAGPMPLKISGVAVVLVGRLADGDMFRGQRAAADVEVLEEQSFHPALRTRQVPAISVILGAQSDWPRLAEVGMRMGEHPAVIVFLSTSAVPLIRDLEYQANTTLPTLAFFAPYATSTVSGRDPVKTIAPLIEMLREQVAYGRPFNTVDFFVAQHNLLLREPIWAEQDPIELLCRLAVRAIKAGAVLDGDARLYRQGYVDADDFGGWESAMGHLFHLTVGGATSRIDGRRAALLLLVERWAKYDPSAQREATVGAVRRLFHLRGWSIGEERGQSFDLEARPHPQGRGALLPSDQTEIERRFSVIVIDNARDMPSEDPKAPAPGLTRAPLLVIHTQSRREALLVGNRGQFFHASIDDIPLIKPGTPWVWAVLKRQLFNGNGRLSQAALRLSAALVIEAIQFNHVDASLSNCDLSDVHQLLLGPDFERFVRFAQPRRQKGPITLAISAMAAKNDEEEQLFIDLSIEREGPVIALSDLMEFPFD